MTVTLEKYFGKIWKPNIDQYHYSGWRVLSLIKETDQVLDVGCGYNLFKSALGNRLTGIDPYNDAADHKVSIEDWHYDYQYDVVLCLGSINFGSEETILKQLDKIATVTKTGGKVIWRQNPGRKDHNNKECQDIDFFDWSFQKNLDYAKRFGFEVDIIAWDNGKRIYAEWTKL